MNDHKIEPEGTMDEILEEALSQASLRDPEGLISQHWDNLNKHAESCDFSSLFDDISYFGNLAKFVTEAAKATGGTAIYMDKFMKYLKQDILDTLRTECSCRFKS